MTKVSCRISSLKRVVEEVKDCKLRNRGSCLPPGWMVVHMFCVHLGYTIRK